ncbi:hypothetical protein VU08_04670 [Desulfobulbus sp. F5]|nr:hypothetical protein [Desulfobulbus sp. F5]
MAFYLPLPQVCVKLERHFIIDEVRTKGSQGHKDTLQDVKDKYKEKIQKGSEHFFPDIGKKYIICFRTTCCKGRKGGIPSIDNVAKEIVNELFPAGNSPTGNSPTGNSVDIVKGIQAEGEIIAQGNEQSEVYIYSILCQQQNS